MTDLYHQITIEAPAERNTTWGCLMRQFKHHLEGIPFNPVFTVSVRLR